ncbi:MAG: hypothetical protein ABH863_01405 [Candidatus Micrarchaeota archaeon]
MAGESQLNQILDAIIAVLAIVILFVWLNRKQVRGFRSRPHRVEQLKKQKDLKETRRVHMSALNDLSDARSQLLRIISESKRRYMKGEITYEAMGLITKDAQKRLIEIDERLGSYEVLV